MSGIRQPKPDISATGIGSAGKVPSVAVIPHAAAPSAKRQLAELVRAVSGLFSGGALEEEDRDAAMEAIIAAYWAAKRDARKAETGKKADS